MRDPNTYRAAWRNVAHKAGALRLCNAYLSANYIAKYLEREKQCAAARKAFNTVAAGFPLNPKLAQDAGRKALIEFWRGQKRTRVVSRIIRELTGSHSRAYAGGH